MSRISLLYDLQELDTQIQAREAALHQVESELGESEELLQAREAVALAREHSAELQVDQREREYQTEDLRTKVATLESRLYGGSVRNPKDMVAVQEEANSLKHQLQDAENGILELMESVESSQRALTEGMVLLERVEGEWSSRQEGLNQQQQSLSAELEGLRTRRDVLKSPIAALDIGLYERLLGLKAGKAVVKVERGMCQGCRITLPMNELQRARAGQEIVQCGSCERILFVG